MLHTKCPSWVMVQGECRLKVVNHEIHDNNISHETEGLSKDNLVVRRGKPFKLTLMFEGRSWNPTSEVLVLEVLLGDMTEKFLVHYDQLGDPERWTAKINRSDMYQMSCTVYICSPVLSSVALYDLVLHIESDQVRRTYKIGSFVLICNPWHKEDPVYMPLDAQKEEYVKSDYGLLYMGTPVNISTRPWSFGQYEPGILEACLKLLQVSPNHQCDRNKDYSLRANPVYLSRVVCAMVNSNDDLGILTGKWQGSYTDGVKPTDWSGSADIINQWASSDCKPVRYGQCWVFASVLCTVMRVLGIPSRVVTVFNAAHDADSSLKIEEYYSTKGEKLQISKDSIWNFHVWAECWMRRPDLGSGFDGWQVVDPTPQERSGGIYRCGPCPVAAIQHGCLGAPYDASFIFASVDADIVRMIVRDKMVVETKEDNRTIGKLIYTKSINSDKPENLTPAYKQGRRMHQGRKRGMHSMTLSMEHVDQHTFPVCLSSGPCGPRSRGSDPPVVGNSWPGEGGYPLPVYLSSGPCQPRSGGASPLLAGNYLAAEEEPAKNLEVSVEVEGTPTLGASINLCVTVTNCSNSPRVLKEYLNAQLKEFNSVPQESFWKEKKIVNIKSGEVLKLKHAISPSDYETFLSGDDIVNLAVVVEDTSTKERFLATEEFNMASPHIEIEVEGGDNIQLKETHTVQVSFVNTFDKTLKGAVLTVEGSGLLKGRHEARLDSLQHGNKIEKQVAIQAFSPGTKILMATFSHSNCPNIVSRCFHKVSVKREGH